VEAFVGVGSNVDPEKNILAALPEIEACTQVLDASRFYRNPALAPDRRERPPFVNGVLRIRTGLTPHELKYEVLRKVESKVQRIRTGDRYGPRTLDLDLLVYGDLEVESDEITLPDPDISVQPFWALPLAELVPEMRPPDTGLSMKELARTMDTRSFVYLESLTSEIRRTLRLVNE
jgi:dihydroneopterin aldolase/2-amino-4-hydroxy-6-hydroxymethyldihydropteridine diphosphokinase